MQFNSIVTVQTALLNDFSEATVKTTENMKCAVAGYERTINVNDRAKRKQHDLVIIVPCKNYTPYENIFDTDHAKVKILYNSKTFELKEVSRVNYSTGKPKHYIISLDQVRF